MSRVTRVLLGALATVLVAATPAQAGPQTLSVPVDGLTVYDFCAADWVTLSGALDLKANTTVSNGTVSLKATYNAGGIKGAGVFSGAKFVGNGTGGLKASVKDPFPARLSVPFRFFLLRQGAKGDLKVNAKLNVTVDNQGRLSDASLDVTTANCG